MSTKYTIHSNFIGNLVSLVITHKPKTIGISRFNFLEIARVSREVYDPQLSFNVNTNTLRVKAETKIRNPKDFSLFIVTYVECLLVVERLPTNTVVFKNNYTQGEYIEEAIQKYGEWELQSQNFLTITTQGNYLETIIESQSGPTFVSIKSQSQEVIQTQSYQPIEMPIYSIDYKVAIDDDLTRALTARYYDRSEVSFLPIAVKGALTESYSRTYKN